MALPGTAFHLQVTLDTDVGGALAGLGGAHLPITGQIPLRYPFCVAAFCRQAMSSSSTGVLGARSAHNSHQFVVYFKLLEPHP